MTKIAKVIIDEKSLIRSDHNKNERERIITDITKENKFEIDNFAGPYDLYIELADSRLNFEISANENKELIQASLVSLRRIIKDYNIVCESYFEAIRDSDPRKVEAIDMGRRGLHNEGAELLTELLEAKAKFDFDTARKLFSLIYTLQAK